MIDLDFQLVSTNPSCSPRAAQRGVISAFMECGGAVVLGHLPWNLRVVSSILTGSQH